MSQLGQDLLRVGVLFPHIIHIVDIQPLGMSIDYEEEHLPNKSSSIAMGIPKSVKVQELVFSGVQVSCEFNLYPLYERMM